jgi:hypothetical protein
VPWDYKENEIVQGATYGSIDKVKDVVKHWSLYDTRVQDGEKHFTDV